MIRILFIFLISFLVSNSAQCEIAPNESRAIWIWEKDSYAMLEQESSRSLALDFFKSKGINRIYIYSDEFNHSNIIKDQPSLYKELIKYFHKNGISVYALLGSGHLNTEEYILPERRKDALTMVDRVLRFNSASSKDERFDGINLDIEPHILDAWPERKMQLLEYFLNMSKAIMDLKHKSGLELQVGPAIPFWFDGIQLNWNGVTKSVSDHTFDLYDYAALMDYRDHAEGQDGIISHALDELAYAGKIRKKVAIGIEVTPNEIRKVSFNHLTERDMNRELDAAAKEFLVKPAFDGFVIHHYRGYLNWLETQ